MNTTTHINEMDNREDCPKRRGRPPIYDTEEKKQKRREKKLEYYKNYYSLHKETLKKQSSEALKNRIMILNRTVKTLSEKLKEYEK